MTRTIPVPATDLRPLWLAVVVAVAFLALTFIQGAARESYDSWHQAVSALSLGPRGWLQMANLVAFGATIAATAPAWSRILAGGRGARSYPVLIALIGASFVGAGLVPQDPAPGYDPAGLARTAPTATGLAHLALAGVAAACSVASLLVLAGRLAGDPHWPGWARSARFVAALVVACVAVYGAWSVEATGYAGTFERMAIVLPLAWNVAFLRRLESGTPFRVAPRIGSRA